MRSTAAAFDAEPLPEPAQRKWNLAVRAAPARNISNASTNVKALPNFLPSAA